MISSAFKSAYTNEVSAEHKVAGNIQSGIRDATSATASIILAGIGMNEAKVNAGFAKAAAKTGGSRIGGIGGMLVSALTGEKKMAAQAKQDTKQMFSGEEVKDLVNSQLGDNPINRSATNKLNTVFDTLVSAKENGIIKNNKIKTSNLGDIDVNSPFGKQIIEKLGKEA